MRVLIENLDFALTVDADDSVIKNAAMVVEDDRIADIGSTQEVLAAHDRNSFDEVIDGHLKGICPGFVDSHVHLSEMLSRAVFPDHIDTRTWVFHWAKPFYAHVDEDDEYISVLVGACEMLRCGTTCFLDMGAQNDPGITVRAVEEIGIRGIVGRHAADNPPAQLPQGWDEEMVKHHFFPDAETALTELAECVKKWHNSAGGRVKCWVNIEGKEPCSLELHVGARKLAETLGVGTTYHLATSIEEAEVAEKKYGVWPITRVERAGGLGSNLVIAHGSAVADEEVELLAKYDTKVAFCPGTSYKLGKGACSIGKYPEMIDSGVTVGLGTDGVSASGNVNLMRQMYAVAGMFKDSRMDPSLIGAKQALRMATIDGAKALMWDDEIGSLEIGKKADFIIFDLDHIEWTPHTDPLNAIVWAASPASIVETWVDGKAVYKDNKVQNVDEKQIKIEARSRAAEVVKRARLNVDDVPVTTSLYDEGN